MQKEEVFRTTIPGYPRREGKVRDVYDLGDKLVIVATDRISAFDWVMPTPVPGKGRLLTAVSKFWFELLGVPNHWISDDISTLPDPFLKQRQVLEGRTMIVRKTKVVPFECVARGYLAGSGWKEYKSQGTVCGVPLPGGLRESERLPEAIFTPATKAEEGHDENVSFESMANAIGLELATQLKEQTLAVYRQAAAHATNCGIILADTKFEWGQLPDGSVILIDEVLTPDSSRYWPADQYEPGRSPPSFDKQYLRDWLESTGWDKSSPPPELPAEVVAITAAKYAEVARRITGMDIRLSL